MIQKASNPFQPAPGASPPELVGRSSELAAIWDATERAKSGSVPTPLVFTGLRGIGKTVLLTRLIDSAGAHAVPIRLEVESEVPLSDVVQDAIARLLPTLRSVPKKLLAAVDAALRLVPKLNYELPNELGALSLEAPADDRAPHLPLRTAIESLNAAVSSIGRFLVITIDEIHDADIASLRTIAAGVHQSAASGNPILLACAGLPQTVEVIAKLRTYAHRWDRFELDLLRGPEVAQAIRLPIERNGATIDRAALDLLIEQCAGYPFFVQKYASAAWTAHRGRSITLADVERVVPGVRAGIEKAFYRDAFDDLSPRERMLVIALADLGPGAHELRAVSGALGVGSMALGSIRTRLIKKGVVFAPRAGYLQFRIPLAERYVADHREAYETPDVIAYRKAFRRDGDTHER
jgi:hypothetical protein